MDTSQYTHSDVNVHVPDGLDMDMVHDFGEGVGVDMRDFTVHDEDLEDVKDICEYRHRLVTLTVFIRNPPSLVDISTRPLARHTLTPAQLHRSFSTHSSRCLWHDERPL
jgi:hypothetical protein